MSSFEVVAARAEERLSGSSCWESRCSAWTTGEAVVKYPMSDGCVEIVAGRAADELRLRGSKYNAKVVQS